MMAARRTFGSRRASSAASMLPKVSGLSPHFCIWLARLCSRCGFGSTSNTWLRWSACTAVEGNWAAWASTGKKCARTIEAEIDISDVEAGGDDANVDPLLLLPTAEADAAATAAAAAAALFASESDLSLGGLGEVSRERDMRKGWNCCTRGELTPAHPPGESKSLSEVDLRKERGWEGCECCACCCWCSCCCCSSDEVIHSGLRPDAAAAAGGGGASPDRFSGTGESVALAACDGDDDEEVEVRPWYGGVRMEQ